MKRYTLKTKTGESISYTFANSIEEAQIFFSKIKKIELNTLLEIFIVEEVVLS